jgi:hypothetical protein
VQIVLSARWKVKSPQSLDAITDFHQISFFKGRIDLHPVFPIATCHLPPTHTPAPGQPIKVFARHILDFFSSFPALLRHQSHPLPSLHLSLTQLIGSNIGSGRNFKLR